MSTCICPHGWGSGGERDPRCEVHHGQPVTRTTLGGPAQAHAMDFQEAWARAQAAHEIEEVWRQPGNGYRPENVCTCGKVVPATRWKQHIIDAADRIRAG